MQARLETRRDPSRVVAIVFALVAAIALGVAGAYTLKALSAPAAHSVQGTAAQSGHGPDSDLTRVLPVAAPAHGPDSAIPAGSWPTGPVTVTKAGTNYCEFIDRHKVC